MIATSSGEAAPALRADGLTRTYGSGETAVHALVDATLELHSGELVVVRGASGSGKTTLLNLLGGLDTPSRGTIEVAGTSIAGLSGGALSR